MNKTERTIVGLVIAVICPASLFFLFWWISAALSIFHILPVPQNWIGIIAVSGLFLGIVLDAFYLRRWMERFYNVNTTFMMVAYLFWSAIAVALSMGLPLLNIALGILAGLYIGRKRLHEQAARDAFRKTAWKVSLFTALVTGLEALPIGLLGLKEELTKEISGSTAGLSRSFITGPADIAIIIMLCLILTVIQFLCTRAAAKFAFGLGASP